MPDRSSCLFCNYGLQGVSGRMQLRLNGLQQQYSSQQGEGAAAVPPCGPSGMQRTQDRWKGPVDLDAAAAARAAELNRSWVGSKGGVEGVVQACAQHAQ